MNVRNACVRSGAAAAQDAQAPAHPQFLSLALLAGIVLYFVSDLSKVHSLSVSGNFFTAMRDLCACRGRYETRYLSTAFLMESGLQNDIHRFSGDTERSQRRHPH
ncbi:MAG: hypothetical protein ACLVJ6_13660 [Merdibacter sp.]